MNMQKPPENGTALGHHRGGGVDDRTGRCGSVTDVLLPLRLRIHGRKVRGELLGILMPERFGQQRGT